LGSIVITPFKLACLITVPSYTPASSTQAAMHTAALQILCAIIKHSITAFLALVTIHQKSFAGAG